MALVLQTDFAWADDSVERSVIEQAGHVLVSGPSTPMAAAWIEDFVARHDPQAIMTCWGEVTARAIAGPTDLRIVQRIGVGLDNIAVASATLRGAWVANVPDYCVGEVSDHAVGLLLAWARGIVAFDREAKLGGWNPASARLRRVSDLTVGLVGYGRIGRATASKLRAFGCRLLVNAPSARTDDLVCATLLEDLLAQSDVVILHAPLTSQTHHLIDARRLSGMRPGAFLINVSRGPMVDNQALLDALESGRLSGAGLDVIEGEPAPPRALMERPDVVITPHVAFSSEASLIELRRRAAEEVVRVLAGHAPRHACNRPDLRS
ncbi:phosphoglycerate dehydrogenase-like oxidoreductase [Caulobacter sp. AP07]|uniref:C-terminal binding protein n=1 Tax=Caulobacter sp. AP07 TaxID=1144304 RepID=UPI0002721183|nr:C-terminal binding protein [Caulobacter sp. AP07]EJL27373.1 phosphoglycerate dehydrogenase-like oxidoreductase [Caulobacter sp. AP07]